MSNELGLVDAHAYSIIAALDADIGLLAKERLVLIRNPWGFREWSGDWSDLSSKWDQYPNALSNIQKQLDKRAQEH